VTCAVGSLASGASATITIKATAPPTSRTNTKTATIGGNEPDPNAANNTASASTQVSAAAKSVDLAVTKTGPAAATTGGPIAYTLTAKNNGPDAATGATVTDTLPSGVGFTSATSTLFPYTTLFRSVTCAVGSLASGASAT